MQTFWISQGLKLRFYCCWLICLTRKAGRILKTDQIGHKINVASNSPIQQIQVKVEGYGPIQEALSNSPSSFYQPLC